MITLRILHFIEKKESTQQLNLEVEANKFAASFLMPRNLVEKVWQKLKDVDECAHIFSVSIVAMSIRLSELDLVE